MPKLVTFRRQSYDAVMLTKLANQGHRQEVATTDINTIAAAPEYTTPVAVLMEGKFHLLTGKLDAKQPKHTLHVLSKMVLKKALINEQYSERRADNLSQRDINTGMGALSQWHSRNR